VGSPPNGELLPRTLLDVHMYRALALAVLLAAPVLSSRLEGQMRAMRSPSSTVRISTSQHFLARQPSPGRFDAISRRPFRRALLVRSEAFRRHLRFHISLDNSCFTGPFFDPFFCRQFFFRNRFPFAQPVFLPYPVYATPNYQAAEQTPAIVADRDSDVAREVSRLRDEVEQMREEQVSRGQARLAAPEPRPSVEEKTPTTILVFRDGHRSEVQNLAIVGQTLWVLTEQRARKMPISDLDVEATETVNADRGVEFRLPQ
jgi:hypothetical protein